MCQTSESSSASMLMRIPSSHGESDYSDFEFDFSEVFSGEPLVSPKLHNFSAYWKDAASSMVSTTQSHVEHMYTASPNIHNLHTIDASQEQALDGAVTDSDSIKCPHTYLADGVNDMNEHMLQRNCDCLIGASSGEDVHAGGVSTIPDQNQKVTLNLRSLILDRRDSEVEQMPPLVTQARNQSSDEMILRSSTSRSSSDASSSNSPSASFDSALSSPEHHPKKNRRWSSKLAFLQTKKLASAPKAVEDPHLNQAPAMMTDKRSGHHAPETRDHDDAKGESPTCRRRSVSSGGSFASVVKRERNMHRKSKSASTPVSPAASPSRAAGPFSPAKGPVGAAHAPHRSSSPMCTTPAAVKRTPMSPHAQHYQQQRARADELRRRTLLPYRQPLFAGVCFSAELVC